MDTAETETDLFAGLNVRSFPPRLVELRRFYDEAKAAFDAASEHEDESGEEIPREIKMDFQHWERQLRIEEARVATVTKMSTPLISDNPKRGS